MLKKKSVLLVIVILLILSLNISFLNCKNNSATDLTGLKGWDLVLAKARIEGELNIYGGSLSTEYTIPIIKKDMWEKYGIKVNYLDLTPSGAMARVKAEASSGTEICDITGDFTTPQIENMRPFLDMTLGQGFTIDGEFIRYLPEYTYNTKPEDWVFNPLQNKDFYMYFYSPLGFMVNTKVLSEKGLSLPTGWAELADPKYKGLYICRNEYTNVALGTAGRVEATLLKLGWSQQQLKDWLVAVYYTNKPTFPAGFSTSWPPMIAKGEYAIFGGATFEAVQALLDVAPSLPIKWYQHIEGELSPFYQCLMPVKNPPHPNTALVFLNYMLSKEGQTSLLQARKRVVRVFSDSEYVLPEFQNPKYWKFAIDHVLTLDEEKQYVQSLYQVILDTLKPYYG